MASTRATFEYTLTGQQKAYGDTITEGILTVEMASDFHNNGEFRPVSVGEDQAKRMALGFNYWTDDKSDPFAPRLDSFTVLGEGRYLVRTRSMYND